MGAVLGQAVRTSEPFGSEREIQTGGVLLTRADTDASRSGSEPLPTRRAARMMNSPPNGKAFSGEPSERSERPERSEGRRVRCKDEMDSSRDVSGIMVPASYGVIGITTERRSPWRSIRPSPSTCPRTFLR
jgi:hypothetical protein